MRRVANPPPSARVQLFLRPRADDALPEGGFGVLLADLGALGDIPMLDRRGIGRAVEFVLPRTARVDVARGSGGAPTRLRLDPHVVRAVRADLTAALRAQGLHPKAVAHQDAVAKAREGAEVPASALLDGVWLTVGREVRALSFCAGGRCRRPDELPSAANPPRREAWEMTLAEFLGTPRRSRADRHEVPPWYPSISRTVPAEPFMAGVYTIRRGAYPDGAPLYTVLDGEKPVASYDGYQLLVARSHRRKGIATELVADLRMRHPEVPPATTRTAAAERVQRRAHHLIVWLALLNGHTVPDRVLKKYPDLSRLANTLRERRAQFGGPALATRRNGTARQTTLVALYGSDGLPEDDEALWGCGDVDPDNAFEIHRLPMELVWSWNAWDGTPLSSFLRRPANPDALRRHLLAARAAGRIERPILFRSLDCVGAPLKVPYLLDGYHRLAAAHRARLVEIDVIDVSRPARQTPRVATRGNPGNAEGGSPLFDLNVHDDEDDPDEEGIWQRFWLWRVGEYDRRHALGMLVAARRMDHVAWGCQDDRDELRRAVGLPRMPVFHVESSVVFERHRATGLGVSLYVEAARVARTRFGAMLVAGDCKRTDETSASAARVWESRRLAADPRVMVRGHCMVWIGGSG